VDFLLVLIKLFSLGVTAEVLRVNIEYAQSHGLFSTAKLLMLVSELAHVTTHFNLSSSPQSRWSIACSLITL